VRSAQCYDQRVGVFAHIPAMANPVFRVELRDGEIVITMPGTNYKVTFRKLADALRAATHELRSDLDAPKPACVSCPSLPVREQ
jgi:hypothetical protein